MPEQNTKDFQSITNKSNNILLIVPENASTDILSSAFACFWFLKKKQKEVSLLSDKPLPRKLSFLKEPDNLISDLAGSRDFLLMFSTKRNKIIDLKSEQMDDQFVVRLTPEKGSIDPRDFSFVPAEFRHDLLIIFGSPSFESLGKIHENNTDLFFEVPKVNIDNHSDNENYAQVNIVDMTASSVAEVCASLLLEEEKNIDQNIAQGLLAGIISATDSFQKPTTTPRSMVTAAKLMKYKADQATVIRYLYKTKSLSFLKLWGRVMARLDYDKDKKFAWSLISTEDFVQSKSTEADVPYVLDEIRKNFSQGQIFGIFYADNTNTTHGLFSFVDSELAKKVAKIYELNPANGIVEIEFDKKNLLESEKDFLEKLRGL